MLYVVCGLKLVQFEFKLARISKTLTHVWFLKFFFCNTGEDTELQPRATGSSDSSGMPSVSGASPPAAAVLPTGPHTCCAGVTRRKCESNRRHKWSTHKRPHKYRGINKCILEEVNSASLPFLHGWNQMLMGLNGLLGIAHTLMGPASGSSGGGICCSGSDMSCRFPTLWRTLHAITMWYTFSELYSSMPPVLSKQRHRPLRPIVLSDQLSSQQLTDCGNGGHCTSALGQSKGWWGLGQLAFKWVAMVTWGQLKADKVNWIYSFHSLFSTYLHGSHTIAN